MKSRSREIGNLNYHIVLEFDWLICSTAADVPVKFQSDLIILNTNLAASRLCDSEGRDDGQLVPKTTRDSECELTWV